jgi:hypothetical protein
MALYGVNPITRAHILDNHTSAPTGDVGRLKVKGNRNNVPIAVIVEIKSGLIVSGWPRRLRP